MSSKTKIVVLHMKEVVYTAIFLVLAILMIILVFVMFSGKDKRILLPNRPKRPCTYPAYIHPRFS